MTRMRVKCTKQPPLHGLVHKDYAALLGAGAEEAGLPVVRAGRRGKVRIESGPPLTAGYTSRAEYFDLPLAAPITARRFAERLARALPAGADLLWSRAITGAVAPLRAGVRALCYTVAVPLAPARVAAFHRAARWPLLQERKGRTREVDLKETVGDVAAGERDAGFTIWCRSEGMPKPFEVVAALFEVGAGEAMQYPVERVAVRFSRQSLPRPTRQWDS
jgi:radical SAM-linked protein